MTMVPSSITADHSASAILADVKRMLEAAGLAPPDAGYPTIAQAHSEWVLSLGARSTATVRTYQTGYNAFCAFLAELGVSPQHSTTETVSEILIEQFLAWLLVRHTAEQRDTLLTYRAGVSSFARFLVRRHYAPLGFRLDRLKEMYREMTPRGSYRTPRVDVDGIAQVVLTAIGAENTPRDRSAPVMVQEFHVPATIVPAYAKRSSLGKPFITSTHSRRAYTTAAHPAAARQTWVREPLNLARDRALLAMLFNTGMRRAEVVSLNRSDIRRGEALILGKGRKERSVFFDGRTMALLEEYLALRDDRYRPVFIRVDAARNGTDPGPDGDGWRLDPQSVWLIVRRFMKAAGIEHGSPHAFRHVKACLMLAAGADLSTVQDLLGHASPETTKKIYAQYSPGHLRKAARRYNVSAEDAGRVWSSGGE